MDYATQNMTVECDPKLFSDAATSLVLGLLNRDPEKRLGVKGLEEFTSHPFFAGVDWEALSSRQISMDWIVEDWHQNGVCTKPRLSRSITPWGSTPAMDQPVIARRSSGMVSDRSARQTIYTLHDTCLSGGA